MVCKCYHADKNFLGEIGVCWGTKERESCSCRGDEAKCDFYDYVRERVKKPITNADKIRQMSDEELADFIGGIFTLDSDVWGDYDPRTVVTQEPRVEVRNKEDMLDWLKQEVERDG